MFVLVHLGRLKISLQREFSFAILHLGRLKISFQQVKRV